MKIIMKNTLLFLAFILSLDSTLALPYSTENGIQLYTEVPENFYSSNAKRCLEEANKKGTMSELDQKLGCSNHETAEKICSCVDMLFDEAQVKQYLESPGVTNLASMIEGSKSFELERLTPHSLMVGDVNDINMIYEEMGVGACSFGSNDPFFEKVGNKFIGHRDSLKKQALAREDLNRQHQIFNRELKRLGKSNPSRDEIFELSKIVSAESGKDFFLERRINELRSFDFHDEDTTAKNDIRLQIINEYISFHQHEITRGVDSDEFQIDKVSRNVTKESGREGCRNLLSYVSVKKEEDQEKKILDFFSNFFPDSYLDKAVDEQDRAERLKDIQGRNNGLDAILSMRQTPEFKKDILYCSKYNQFKEKMREISENEELKKALVELESLKDNTLLNILSRASSSEDQEVKDVLEKIENLENEIMAKFNMPNKEELQKALMAFKFWKVDKGVKTVVSEDGTLALETSSRPNGGRRSLTDRMNDRTRTIRNSKRVARYVENPSSLSVAGSNNNSSNTAVGSRKSPRPSASRGNNVRGATAQVNSDMRNSTRSDNYFNRGQNASQGRSMQNSLSRSEERSGRSFSNGESEDQSYEDFLANRIEKLKRDKLSTEKELSDELASTKESLELAKLREELRKQSEEIAKLTKKKEEVSNSIVEAPPTISRPDPSSFKSPLASALDKAYGAKSNPEDIVARGGDSAASRATAANASYSAPVEGASQGSSSSSSSSNSSAASLSDDGSSVSGISLSSLRSIGEDVQVIDNTSLGEIRPIMVDASFAELSEEEKRLKIEELLETTPEDEVYIEFPDGKVLKFSKKDEENRAKKVDKKNEAIAKELLRNQRREKFSYDRLKEIIDGSKE